MIDEKTYEHIDGYLKGTLDEDTRNNFEQRLQSDSELREELEIQKKLYEHFEVHSEEEERLQGVMKSIEDAGKAYHGLHGRRKKLRYFIPVAASIVLLVGYFMFFGSSSSMDSLYAEYSDWDSLPSLTERGTEVNTLQKAADYFSEKSYAEAISALQTHLEKDPENPLALSYLGLSHLEMQNYDEAIKTFDLLQNGTSLDRNKALWYKAMTYLKAKDEANTISTLEHLLEDSNNYKHKEANELLKTLQ
ncbi:tetratricopeptide repeat protein [Aureisphaera galaxeae]|uniref:tetratricopeptide repeat protein n=1 Tax=Aureisphaera galaxeae TaxID=1538023 RepID=UPI00234FDFB4|nr:tetratricopeptide repeat protein [Aureisphaera galaxeae]MDC8004682.1 tetratricopeptide repeat protein [Aureisphaera galaxeae]